MSAPGLNTSPVRPRGHVNDWPLPDYRAFEALVALAERRIGPGGDDPVEAYAEAADALGLGRSHWLVGACLEGLHGLFRKRTPGASGPARDWYLPAGPWLTRAGSDDLADPEAVSEAMRLTGARTH